MNQHESNDPRQPGRDKAERQRRTTQWLLLTIGVLLGLIAFTFLVQHDLFGMGGT